MAEDTTPSQEQPDTITRWAVYNEDLQQYVGGVSIGAKPKDADVKNTLQQLGMEGHKYDVRQV